MAKKKTKKQKLAAAVIELRRAEDARKQQLGASITALRQQEDEVSSNAWEVLENSFGIPSFSVEEKAYALREVNLAYLRKQLIDTISNASMCLRIHSDCDIDSVFINLDRWWTSALQDLEANDRLKSIREMIEENGQDVSTKLAKTIKTVNYSDLWGGYILEISLI